MMSNPRLLFYSCIARGTVILADFSSKDEPEIEALALRCIQNVPSHHSMISQTVRKRTYASIIDGLFTYFAILDEAATKKESLWLFTRLKSAMEALVSDGSALDKPTQHCLQSKLDPVFAEIAGGGNNNNKDLEPELGLDSSKEQRALKPLLAKPLMVLKKNKKRVQTEAKMDVAGGVSVSNSRGLPRNGLIHDHHHRQKAKQIWKKHVWVVLMFDVCICLVLFGIWLWVCQGFQCIQA
ncbi:phytolongin Phyl2.1 isoform X2 [Brassica napus]|uniref:phytolongin Phyl2.1 isoform X2 n=1 Tax=Brassica napus TaxID=3708 RepID=UPI00207ADC79|nr:phytolongin Phyl2.1 isoform X2 [Brassica napus]